MVECSRKLNLDFLDGESITVNRTTRRRLSMTILLFVSFVHRALHFLTRLRECRRIEIVQQAEIYREFSTEKSRQDNFSYNFPKIIFHFYVQRFFFYLKLDQKRGKFKYNFEDGDFRSMDERLLEEAL